MLHLFSSQRKSRGNIFLLERTANQYTTQNYRVSEHMSNVVSKNKKDYFKNYSRFFEEKFYRIPLSLTQFERKDISYMRKVCE